MAPGGTLDSSVAWQWQFSTKIRGAEVLNLPSALEVVGYLSSTSVFHKNKACKKTMV